MSAVLYLLPLGLVFDLCGYMPPSLRLFLVYGLLALPLCLKPSRQSAVLALGLVAVMALRAVLSPPPVAEMVLLLLAHQVIWAVHSSPPRALQAGLAAYTLLHVFLFHSPLGHPWLEGLAAALGAVAGVLTGSSYNLGWTYQNVGGLLLFLCLSVMSWSAGRVSMLRSGLFVLVAVLLNTLSAAIMMEFVDFKKEFTFDLEFRESISWGELAEKMGGVVLLLVPGMLFLAYLVAYLFLHHDKASSAAMAAAGEAASEGESSERDDKADRESSGDETGARSAGERPEELRERGGWAVVRAQFGAGKASLIVTGLAVVALLVLVPPTSWRRPAASELVFLNKGVVSFTKPNYQSYGRAAGGMFGLLPDYAQLFGCRTSVVNEVPETLDPGQILVVTSVDLDLGEEVRKRIWEFVEAGGRLWVMGDHTFIKNGRNHLNDFLEPIHISYENDSAQFFPQGWFHSYRFREGTPFARLRDDAENRPGILVGASLKLAAPAQPFVVGRFGYSDWGLEEPDDERGYLGDFEYQQSERLGDLVLVAGERYGKGRVLVVGDTSSFFNNNMSRSYELLRALLSWLGESNGWSFFASLPGRVIATVLLLGFLAAVFRFRTQAVALPALAVVTLLSLIMHGRGGLLPYKESFARKHLAVIDFAHEPLASKHSSMGSGLHGVSINFARYGLLPVTINEWDRETIEAAGYVVLNAPRKPLGAGERRDLREFMERGGTVIVACGYQDYQHCRSLLEPFGVAVEGTPLGRFFDRPAFGQPVSFLSAWPLRVTSNDAAVLCVYDNWPLIVSQPVGSGRLVVIGDSEFLHNRNLEGHDNHDPANTAFLKNLLDYVTP